VPNSPREIIGRFVRNLQSFLSQFLQRIQEWVHSLTDQLPQLGQRILKAIDFLKTDVLAPQKIKEYSQRFPLLFSHLLNQTRQQINFLTKKLLTPGTLRDISVKLGRLPSQGFHYVTHGIKTFLAAVISHKRIPHLSRHFGFLAFTCLILYAFSGLSFQILTFLGPPLFFVAWLRVHGGFLVSIVPNDYFYNNAFLVVPATFIYFGLVGFELKNILNERGRYRIVLLVAFLVFLAYLHNATFQEISLYWEGSNKVALLKG